MFQIPKFDYQPYLEIAKRRILWIILPLLVTLIGGGIYVFKTPKIYRASTLILVESQRVPQSYVQSTITESLQSRLQTISQQVHSRTNLEKIIQEFNLFPKQKKKEGIFSKIKRKALSFIGIVNAADETKEEEQPSMLQLVENIRKKINVSLKSRNKAFEISFEWRKPKIAADVTNAIASQFIEQNLRVREEMAMGTTNFLDSEVKRLEQRLEKKEHELEKYKREHMGMLPDQLQSNLNILNQLKDELNNLEKRVDMEKQQAMMLRNQMNMANNNNMGLEMEPLNMEENFQGGEIESLKGKLENMKTRYTDKHPDVLTVKRQIAKLEQQEQENNSIEPPEEDLEMPEFSSQDMFKPQLEQINNRIANYEKRIKEIKAQIEKYKNRVEKTSQVELQLKDLERDYETVRERYHNLLAKKLNAQMAEELEKRQKGEQFRVVDPAIAPKEPFSPDINKIMLMAFVLGLGLGGGSAYLRETLDPAFYTPKEVEDYLDTNVVVSLPIVEKDGE